MAATSASLTHRVARPDFTVARALESALAGAALLTAIPLIAVAAGTVWILSGQAPFVLHRRAGLHGGVLWVPKLRTMWGEAGSRNSARLVEFLQEPVVPSSKVGDPRVCSRFAAFCRRHSIDELPQLALVATGTMRFVGPRPLTQREMDQYYGAAQREVLSATPGLTGLWQVMGRNQLTYSQRRRLDLFLVRRASWKLNGWILLRTVREIVRPAASW